PGFHRHDGGQMERRIVGNRDPTVHAVEDERHDEPYSPSPGRARNDAVATVARHIGRGRATVVVEGIRRDWACPLSERGTNEYRQNDQEINPPCSHAAGVSKAKAST